MKLVENRVAKPNDDHRKETDDECSIILGTPRLGNVWRHCPVLRSHFCAAIRRKRAADDIWHAHRTVIALGVPPVSCRQRRLVPEMQWPRPMCKMTRTTKRGTTQERTSCSAGIVLSCLASVSVVLDLSLSISTATDAFPRDEFDGPGTGLKYPSTHLTRTLASESKAESSTALGSDGQGPQGLSKFWSFF